MNMHSPAMSMASLITFTPLIQSTQHNLIRIERTHDLPPNVHLVASGPFQGIIVNKLAEKYDELATQFPCSFSVWISQDGGKTLKQEIRSFRFCFFNHITLAERGATSQRYIKNLFERAFPKDYASFFTLLLRLAKTDYPQLRAIDIEMKFAADHERMPMPNAKQFVNDGELESLTPGHVKEALEHAYPNSVTEEDLAISLRCTLDEVKTFLAILEKESQIESVQAGEWIRKAYTVPQHHVQDKNPQTVAIITCLFPEKQSIDTVIENGITKHSHSTSGDSNVYTIGKIAGHNVVATKLSMIGGDRMAATSSGSITTRLLGAFQHVDHVIIVGIGGGIPHYTDPEMHIRLGDVVISHPGIDESVNRQIGSYIYAHNVICNWKSGEIEGLAVHDWVPKDNILARTIRNADRKGLLNDWQTNSAELIGKLNEQYKDQGLDFSRPPAETDVLTMIADGNVVVFPHPNAERQTPIYHLGPVGSMFTLRENQQPAVNSEDKIIAATPLKPTKRGNLVGDVTPSANRNGGGLVLPSAAAEMPAENRSASTVSNVDSTSVQGRMTALDDEIITDEENHVNANQQNENGPSPTIPSAAANESFDNNLQTNKQLHDKFISDYHLRAYDAGFDSVIAAIIGSRVDSWVLVRGVADYQQGTTKLGKLWQHYASANAAAMVKTILARVPPPKN